MAIIKDGVLIKAEDSDIINGKFTANPEVRVIGSSAFKNMTNLLEVQLPGNVIGIGSYSFENCTNLRCVTSTNNLLIIGEQAFSHCSRISSFLIDKSDNYQEKEAFQCTGSEFITLFGYYEKMSEGYDVVSNAEASISEDSNVDWFGSTDLNEKYPLYSGIYYEAFYDCFDLHILQIPNKMSVLGEEFARADKLDLVKDLSNIVKFYFDPKACYSNTDDPAQIAALSKAVLRNKVAVRNNLSKVEIKKIPKRTSLIKSLFFSKKSVAIEENESGKSDSNPMLSEEQMEILLEGKITMLEVIEPDIAKHFKEKLEEICSKKVVGPSRHYEISCLYDTFSRVLSIVQTKNIKEIISKDNIDESVFQKYADILIESRDNLETLRRLLNNPGIYKNLKSDLYLSLYEMIKIELINFGSNELYDRMNKTDKMYLYYYFAGDINSDKQSAVASLDRQEPDLQAIKSHLIAQGVRINHLSSINSKPLRIVKLDGERTIIIEKGEPIPGTFPTIKL